MLSNLPFGHIIETTNLINLGINQHKQDPLVPLLGKSHTYACIYAPMISHAIAQKITIQPL